MKKQIVAVDIDDVLFDEHESMRLFMNETYGLQHTAEHYDVQGPYWGYWRGIWGVDDEESERRHLAYVDSGAKAKAFLIPGAIEAINELKERFDLVVITSRYAQGAIDATPDWLEEHFPQVFKRVEFVVDWNAGWKMPKGAIAEKLGASYLIDDSYTHCQSAAELGVHALLFGDYGYSRQYKGDHPLITRAYNWKEATEYLNGQRS
jgi:FMN phosphatase YigB (HAD superfamily)